MLCCCTSYLCGYVILQEKHFVSLMLSPAVLVMISMTTRLSHRDFSGVVSVLICDEMVDIIFEEMR
jgi:hypothetical protein